VLRVSIAELFHRVRVALAAEVLERVRGGNGPQLRRFLERLAGRHALHQSTAERIADSGRVDDAMRRERLRVGSRESRIPSPGSRLLVSRISKLPTSKRSAPKGWKSQSGGARSLGELQEMFRKDPQRYVIRLSDSGRRESFES